MKREKEREKKERRERKGERGKKEKGREAQEERDEEVKKDVTGWTVVTRNKKGEEKDDSDLRQGKRVQNISARSH